MKDSRIVTIYHNTRCSKSRSALTILEEKGITYEVRLYLQEPLTATELKILLKKLDMRAEELIRKSEEIYKTEYAGQDLTDKEWIQVMVKHPVLMERPIVVNGDKAVVARPPERVLEIL